MCMQIGDFATAAQHVAKSVDALASVYGPDGVELGPEYLKLAQLHFHSRQVRLCGHHNVGSDASCTHDAVLCGHNATPS